MNQRYEGFHPVVLISYFVFVIGVSIFVMHPVVMVISALGAIALGVSIGQGRFLKNALCIYVPMMMIAMIVNPLFTHEGVTILWYLPTGNPLTLESLIYGLLAGIMLGTVCMWFYSFHALMTSDRLIYLTGKIMPATSLLFSMSLRFVPEFKRQIGKISDAQKLMGNDVTSGNVIKRMINGIRILSMVITWAFENSIDRADSMRARGYGLPGRNNYSIFRFTKRDFLCLAIIMFVGAAFAYGFLSNHLFAQVYPEIIINEISFVGIIVYFLYVVVCLMPVMVVKLEEIHWNYLQSKI